MPAPERLTSMWPRGWARAVAAALVAVVVSVVLPTTSATAQDSDQGDTDATIAFTIDAGWGAKFQPGESVRVRVQITAPRLLRGTLVVDVGNDQFDDMPSVAVPFEVPGGSTKQYLVVVPTSAQASGQIVTATLLEDDRRVAEVTSRLDPAADTELVGLLPGALAGRPLPGTAPLAVDAGTAQFFPVDPADLATPGVLSSLDVLAAAPGELDMLGPDASTEILTWVAEGGTLLADEALGTEVAGLPTEWQPGPDGRSRAGLGEVRLTAGALADGAFTGLVEPTPAHRSARGSFNQGEPIDFALARDAGLRIPELGWLVGFLLAYVLLAVPLTLTILRRFGRGELGWLVLPLVAVLFTGGAYLAGRELRNEATTSHATVLALSPVGAQATTNLGVTSQNGGDVVSTFPATWAAVPGGNSQFFGRPSSPVRAELTNDGLELRQRLDPGGFAVRAASGPIELDGGMEVVASSDGDSVTGTVRNTLPFDLESVAVFQGTSAVRIGAVGAGDEVPFDVEDQVRGDPFSGPAFEVWREASGFDGPPDPTTSVVLPLWSAYEATSPSSAYSSGSVVVAGWTRAFTPPVEDTSGVLSGRTMVVTSAPVDTNGAGPLRNVQSRSMIDNFGPGGPGVIRATQPGSGPDLDTTGLVVRAPESGVGIEVWREGAWQPLARPEQAPPDPAPQPQFGGLGPTVDLPLLPGSSLNGAMWLRTTPNGLDPFELELRELVTVRRPG